MGFLLKMKKAHFFCVIFLTILVSCQRENKALAEAAGEINNISVIIDDELWNGEIGDSIRNKFASPVIGLPQEEPLFTIKQYPVKLLEGFMSDSRSIIVVKKQPGKKFTIIQNEFAKPQNVIHISGSTVAELRETIEKHAPAMVQMIRQAEIAEMRKRLDTSLIDVSDIEKVFNIGIRIPTGYKPVAKGENFVWLKKDIISGNMNVLIYEVPVRCLEKNANAVHNITIMRDSIGAKYIRGTEPGSDMITEEAYAPYLSQSTISGRKTYETRGTWELKNDFMSGPFINFAIVDTSRKRIIVLEGFCYAPSKDKRDLMFELEAIIKSISIR